MTPKEQSALDALTAAEIKALLATWHDPEIDDYLKVRRFDDVSVNVYQRMAAVRCRP